jgi:hypothetical protein
MMSCPLNGVNAGCSGRVLGEDGESVFRRGWGLGDDGSWSAVPVVETAAVHPLLSCLDRLTHKSGSEDELNGAWAGWPRDFL